MKETIKINIKRVIILFSLLFFYIPDKPLYYLQQGDYISLHKILNEVVHILLDLFFPLSLSFR